jgi:hypothetical protein
VVVVDRTCPGFASVTASVMPCGYPHNTYNTVGVEKDRPTPSCLERKHVKACPFV